MVSLWCPAATPDGRRAEYMTPAEIKAKYDPQNFFQYEQSTPPASF
jgi:Berberine and berberine like